MGAAGGEELARWEKMDERMEVASGECGGKVEKIFVSVRLRPLSEKEVAANDPCDWECINDTTVIFRNSHSERSMVPTAYTFDKVFRSDCFTRQVYEESAKEVALSVVSGINSTIFAYGQTSSGKTYTMTGITEYTAHGIYEYMHKHEERAFVLKFSAIEIYNEAVRDLLSTDSTPLRLLDDPEKGTVIEKLTEETLRDWNQLKELISVCEAQRKTGETSLNEASSRSHQIIRLTIESCAQEFLGKDNSSTLVASVNFVDLAGSERASQALSAGTRLKEGCHINRSLLTLGSVIRKLSKGRNGHIPYRDSKLTRILQLSLGGNARTAIICTMSPARSHIEQSRNTLLFASCAKEVATSAQVNVVMSDKALVRHLQKEVARLESELRYPGISLNTEALMREKDVQLKKMENQIKELIQQRDKAQSRVSQLEGLLQAFQKDHSSRLWEELSPSLSLNLPYACGDLLSTYEPSDVAELSLDSASSKFVESHNRQDMPIKNQAASRPTYSIADHKCNGLNQNQGEEGINENLYEVRCIEMNEANTREDSDSLSTEGRIRSSEHVDRNHKPEGQMDMGSSNGDPVTLEQHLQNVKKTIITLVQAYPDGSSPWSLSLEPNFKSSPFRRSRSCKSTTMRSSWLVEDSTPPSPSFKDFPGRTEGFQNKRFALNFGDEFTKPSTRGSQNSEENASYGAQKLVDPEDASSVEMGRLDDYTKLKEMGKVDQRKEWNGAQEDIGSECILMDVGLASPSSLDPPQSPSTWAMEFEKKQREIINLWHDCNVSLVHRTCFYMLLFKGDPADSIYMEVELRRLSFLKNNFSRRSIDEASSFSPNSNSISSLRFLRSERDMLCRQMQRSLSAADRESLYIKWGIALDSKQRKLQLARRLWSETKDMEHVRESACAVARLVGVLEQGQALKEMFGLTFSPQKSSRRSYIWRHGLSSSYRK